jgi:CubicO group peptidase (beta-lactamase class C family)
MQKYIFKPLGMEHTFVFDPADGLPASASISYKYNWQAEPVMFADGVYGDKGIYSTVRDMYKWDQSFYQNKLLNNETIELAYGPCSFEKAGVKNYGLGWRMLCFTNGNKIIYHNGWWHGNNTCFYRFIKENFTIIVLGNRFNKNIYKQPKVIYSIIKNTDASQGFDEDE